MTCPATFADVLADRAQAHPDRDFLRFERSADGPLSYGEAWRLAGRWRRLFVETGARRGDAILIPMANELHFAGAFFGAVSGGFVPAPTPPRRALQPDAFAAQLATRAAIVGARVVASATLLALPAPLACATPADLPADDLDGGAGARGSEPGLLQFTSGTSGHPKAVELSHTALLFQARSLTQALGVDPVHDVAASWLPLFHDMGLFGFLLAPLFAGATAVLMRTEAFATRPTAWLEMIARERVSITAGPPSAFALAAKILARRDAAQVDLSSLRVVLMGAEPIDAASMAVIATQLQPMGLDPGVFLPAYGMAEVGVAASLTPAGRGVRLCATPPEAACEVGAMRSSKRREIVSCGAPLPGTTLSILDAAGQARPPGAIGQIALRSPSLANGYRTGAGRADLNLRQGWLLTGDEGFIADGELHVLGRLDEMITVAGSKYAPEEFEAVALELGGHLVAGAVAVPQRSESLGTSRVLLLVETTADPDLREDLSLRIRRALLQRALPIGDLRFIPPKVVRRTPNGKRSRAAYRDLFAADGAGHA